MQQYISSLLPDQNDNDNDTEADQDQQQQQEEPEIEDTIETAVDEESGEVLLSAVALEQEISLELLLNASSSTFDLDNLPVGSNHVVIDTIDQLTDCSESTGWINESIQLCVPFVGLKNPSNSALNSDYTCNNWCLICYTVFNLIAFEKRFLFSSSCTEKHIKVYLLYVYIYKIQVLTIRVSILREYNYNIIW